MTISVCPSQIEIHKCIAVFNCKNAKCFSVSQTVDSHLLKKQGLFQRDFNGK